MNKYCIYLMLSICSFIVSAMAFSYDISSVNANERINYINTVQERAERKFHHANILVSLQIAVRMNEYLSRNAQSGQPRDNKAFADYMRSISNGHWRSHFSGYCVLSQSESLELVHILIADGEKDPSKAQRFWEEAQKLQTDMSVRLPEAPNLPNELTLQDVSNVLEKARQREAVSNFFPPIWEDFFRSPRSPLATWVFTELKSFFYCQVIHDNAQLVQSILNTYSVEQIAAYDMNSLEDLWFLSIHADTDLDIQRSAFEKFHEWEKKHKILHRTLNYLKIEFLEMPVWHPAIPLTKPQ